MILFHKLSFSISYIFENWWCKHLWYFKFRLFDLTEYCEISKVIRHWAAKKQRLENQNLWQIINSFWKTAVDGFFLVFLQNNFKYRKNLTFWIAIILLKSTHEIKLLVYLEYYSTLDFFVISKWCRFDNTNTISFFYSKITLFALLATSIILVLYLNL